MSKNWRPEVEAGDYFGHRQREFDIADRRPVIRKPSDLAGMGPGIGANSVGLIDFNDTLATYDGFYSASRAVNGPEPETTGPDTGFDTHEYVGTVSSDANLGGVQEFTRLSTGVVYRRVFRRAPEDETFISWGTWQALSSQLRPIGEVTMFYGLTPPAGWLILDGSTFDGGDYPDLEIFLGGTTLPDLRDRFPMGASAGAPLGDVDGLAEYELPGHEHDYISPHAHSVDPADPAGGNTINYEPGGTTSPSFAMEGHRHGLTGTATGPSDIALEESDPQTIPTVPPYLALNFIIRAVAA